MDIIEVDAEKFDKAIHELKNIQKYVTIKTQKEMDKSFLKDRVANAIQEFYESIKN